MPDPMVLNDMAGLAILEGRHEDAARLLHEAACSPLVVTSSAKRILFQRSLEQEMWAHMDEIVKLAPKCPEESR